MKTLSIQKIREQLADVVNKAGFSDEITIITRNGKEVAAIVPIKMIKEK